MPDTPETIVSQCLAAAAATTASANLELDNSCGMPVRQGNAVVATGIALCLVPTFWALVSANAVVNLSVDSGMLMTLLCWLVTMLTDSFPGYASSRLVDDVPVDT